MPNIYEDLFTDTVYGCQDIKDDLQVGVWSTSIFFGKHVPEAAAIFNFGFVAFLYYAGVANDQGWPFYAISVVGTAILLMYQLSVLDITSPKSCWGQFFSSRS